ncbi:hypothetical protein V2W30_41070 (plasmid) [Streptomyces sp. Q6]|uniref:Uncharacterized protein n=1 Tax=Streptomyces citrinus TaxID=3118173 RepID=A0ACD5ARB2_9ACTN
MSERSLNLGAWTLASAWRGTALYPLHGTIVVTGRDEDGEMAALGSEILRQAQLVLAMVAVAVQRWRERPPVVNEVAAQGLLVCAVRELAAS